MRIDSAMLEVPNNELERVKRLHSPAESTDRAFHLRGAAHIDLCDMASLTELVFCMTPEWTKTIRDTIPISAPQFLVRDR